LKAGQFDSAAEGLANASRSVSLAFAVTTPADPTRFDYLFPRLQRPASLLPERAATVRHLVELGRAMQDTAAENANNATVSAAYTYFGQFVDHDITLETASASLPDLLNPAMKPMTLDQVRSTLFNMRTATLDLDSVYGLPAPRAGQRMKVGPVSPTGSPNIPLKRPDGKADENDLPRDVRSADPRIDRAALIGDPRNDENTIVAQLHCAFLLAHNKLVAKGRSFTEARRTLRQHYQWIVLHDFLKRVCDPKVIDRIIRKGPKFYRALREPFFLPLEFAVAAYRFGHSMVRRAYDFNVNFNSGGQPSVPAGLQLLFTFTALSGQLGFPGGDFDTLPENWIIEWERFFPAGRNLARRIDTHLVEPLFDLRDTLGQPIDEGGEDGKRLAVRNLLRGYLLRMPTGQAVAKELGLRPLSASALEKAADSAAQVQVLRASGFNKRTPLWYYLLAEANTKPRGRHLGPVGSTLLGEVFVGLIQRSEDSILRTRKWTPELGGKKGKFELPDLLRFAGVLE
jgi:hypothetical protein